MQVVEVKSGIFACLAVEGGANAGFVAAHKGAVVVDTFESPDEGRQLAKALAEHTDRPDLLVINTHHHFDHVLGNQAFDAPIVAHCALADQLSQAVARDLSPAALASWVRGHPEDRWLEDELVVTYPNIVFEDHLLLDLPPFRLVLQHVGGHTPDSIVVDLPDERVLYAGDLVFEGRVPFLRHADIGVTIAALRAMERLGNRAVVPGHGALCDTAYIARFRTYLEELTGAVERLIAAGWEKEAILGSNQLPPWWTADRPELLRANLEHLYDELFVRLAPG